MGGVFQQVFTEGESLGDEAEEAGDDKIGYEDIGGMQKQVPFIIVKLPVCVVGAPFLFSLYTMCTCM